MNIFRFKRKPEITVVTVVFKKEIPLLFLQARSIRKFSKLNLKKIIIVLNDSFSIAEMNNIKNIYYEIYKNKVDVDIILGKKLIEEKYLDAISGWRSQQVLKLKIHSLVKTPYYLTLDAKNHLIRQLCDKDVFKKDKPIVKAKPFLGAMWDSSITNSKKLFDVSLESEFDSYFVPTTPFMLVTEEVMHLEMFLESKEVSIYEAICEYDATEYLLYYFYIARVKKIHVLYFHEKSENSNSVCFFTKGPSRNKDLNKNLISLRKSHIKWLGVHRNRFILNYEVDIKKSIISMWASSKLFDSTNEAEKFWDDYREFLLMKIRKTRE